MNLTRKQSSRSEYLPLRSCCDSSQADSKDRILSADDTCSTQVRFDGWFLGAEHGRLRDVRLGNMTCYILQFAFTQFSGAFALIYTTHILKHPHSFLEHLRDLYTPHPETFACVHPNPWVLQEISMSATISLPLRFAPLDKMK